MLEFFPTHIRALLFLIAAISIGTLYSYLFVFKKKIVIKAGLLWMTITTAAFVVENIWILSGVVVGCCVFLLPQQANYRLAFYFILLPILPAFKYSISKVAGINLLFVLTYPRLLALALLAPMFLLLLKKRNKVRIFFREKTDILVVLYVALLMLLSLRLPTITSAMRESVTLAVDILIPYFVISRYVETMDDFKRVFVGMTVTAVFLSFIGIFEQAFTWWFYRFLPELLNFNDLLVKHSQFRSGWIRIGVTMGSIHLGYFLALSLAIIFYFKDMLPNRAVITYMTASLFGINLLFTGSRGAWLTALLVLLIYTYLKLENARLRLALVAGAVVLTFAALVAPTQFDVQDFDKTGTFRYRLDLLNASIATIKQNPLFGLQKPTEEGDLEDLRQGQGIIDIVNTYLQVGLSSGLIGLLLFVGIFAVPCYQLYVMSRRMRRVRMEQTRLIGVLLLAMLLATMFMIMTVSSISFTPIYYWALLALGSSYIRLNRPELARQAAEQGLGRRARTVAPVSMAR